MKQFTQELSNCDFSSILQSAKFFEDNIIEHYQLIRQYLLDHADEFNQAARDNPTSRKIQISFNDSLEVCDTELKKQDLSTSLTQRYSDRIFFLVFGKVNADKSLFCNFIRYFTFVDGQVVDLKEARFKEGFTETTVTIQGVEIGKRFVLLDSLGLFC